MVRFELIEAEIIRIVQLMISDSIHINSVGTELSEDLCTENLGDQVLNDLPCNVELKIASLLLKLEYIYLVSSVAVDELLQEFDYLRSTASVPLIHQTISQHLQNVNCQVDEIVLQELASTLGRSNPFSASFGGHGPLSTAWKRKTYYKKTF